MAAVAMVTAGVASAAPPSFTVNVNHSSGALATAVNGKLAWSTSLKTVTLSDTELFIKAGECVTLTARGYQGSTAVTPSFLFSRTCALGSNVTLPLENISLTASVPGGVEHVIIRLNDEDHDIHRYANCYRNASSCQQG